MELIEKKGYHCLKHSFRKDGQVITREKYLGKEIPQNIEEIKSAFLVECMKEDLFKRLGLIRKNFHNEWKQYPESVKKEMLVDLSVRFTYNSNAIEGSTITLDETEDLIKHRIAPHKPLRDVQETINHSRVFFNALNEKKLTLKSMLKWHEEIFKDSKPDIAGRTREYLVRVGDYRAPDWQDLKNLLAEFFVWYEKSRKAMQPVELAARAHYRFEKIHPFGDGNGRIGRLIIANVLKNNSYPILTIEYTKRKQYYHALSKTENDFVNYFMRRYLNAHKRYLK